MTQPLLAAQDISIAFHKRVALEHVSLHINPGEIVTLIGPNGSGKTTLLRILLGLQKPDTGQITKSNKLVIGYIPQKMAIDPILPLTVRRFLRLRGNSNNLRDIETVENMARDLEISHVMKSQIHDISGGEMQRVMLARALLLEPNLLVLDEPTQGLDAHGQAEFYKLISEIRRVENCAILMVSHDLHMVMASTDRVICLNHHICCEGHPENVSQDAEYISLFGKESANNIAVYTHKHDHTHDIGGDVVDQ